MRFSVASTITGALLLASHAIAAPVTSTASGESVPQPSISASIERQAGGFLSNGPAPPAGGLHSDTITSFQLIKVNEDAEFVFFSELLSHIENGTYSLKGHGEKAKIVNAIKAIQAQELLHSATAAGILASQGAFVPQPCQYDFGVTDFKTAIATADLFTDVVLSTLIDVQLHAAMVGDVPIVPAIGQVLGQEGEQEGYFRVKLDKNPSESPFLTQGARDFAWSALFHNFIIGGTCDPAIQKNVNLTLFEGLRMTSNVKTDVADSSLGFSFTLGEIQPVYTGGSGYWAKGSGNAWQCNNGTAPSSLPYSQQVSLVYLTGAQVPIVEHLMNYAVTSNVATFDAKFPFISANMSHGLTIGAVAYGCQFTSADDVASKTIYGPALIEVE